MGAPLKNQFWKLATNPGRKRTFKTPDQLWDRAAQYFQWCDEHPLESVEYYGKDATKCDVPKMRAYTWSGLELFLGVESLREYKTNPSYKEFSRITGMIEKIIYTQKFEGAAAGLLNQNIIARDLGLIDKTELTKQKFIVKRKE